MKSDLIDITVALIHSTAGAILVSDSGDEVKAKWLPKSKVEVHETGKTTQAVLRDGQTVMLPLVEVTLPAWLAKDKGLV